MRRPRISSAELARRGWTRVDARPWSKLTARWEHRDGWRLAHCGHATALHPWVLYAPSGQVILRGAAGPFRRADFGTAWNDLEEVTAYVASQPRP